MASNNTHRIIGVLMRAWNGVSRKAIAEQLGVTRALITQQTSSLIMQGFAEEIGTVESSRVGRKEILLRLTAHSGYVLGIDISLVDAAISVLNMRAEIQFYKQITYKDLNEEIQQTILQEVKKQYQAYQHRNLLGTTILVQGYIRDGQCKTVQIDPLIRRIRKLVGENCILQNNVRAMVTVEQYIENPPPDFVLLKYGPGVGAAMVTNNQLITGSSGGAGEIGHIDWRLGQGRHCPVCGRRGCLESEVSYSAVMEKITGLPCRHAGYREVLEASRAEGFRAWHQALDEMAKATAFMVQMMDSSLLYLAGEYFIKRQHFNGFVERLHHYGCSEEKLTVRSIRDYRNKRKKAAGITMLDAYIKNGL